MTDPALPYRLRQDFFSPAEAAFFRVLTEMVSEHLHVCPKVALQDIFFVARPNENLHYQSKIFRKDIDFLLISRSSLKPVLGIELIHPTKTHAREGDAFIESVFAAASLPLVRVALQPSYDIKALAEQFREAMRSTKAERADQAGDYSPICPNCGITMVLRFHRDGALKGQQYYGCLNFPTCTVTLPVKPGAV